MEQFQHSHRPASLTGFDGLPLMQVTLLSTAGYAPMHMLGSIKHRVCSPTCSKLRGLHVRCPCALHNLHRLPLSGAACRYRTARPSWTPGLPALHACCEALGVLQHSTE